MYFAALILSSYTFIIVIFLDEWPFIIIKIYQKAFLTLSGWFHYSSLYIPTASFVTLTYNIYYHYFFVFSHYHSDNKVLWCEYSHPSLLKLLTHCLVCPFESFYVQPFWFFVFKVCLLWTACICFLVLTNHSDYICLLTGVC